MDDDLDRMDRAGTHTEASGVHAGLIVRCGNTVPEVVAHRASALVFAFLIFARCFWYCFSRLSISDFGTDTMCFIISLKRLKCDSASDFFLRTFTPIQRLLDHMFYRWCDGKVSSFAVLRAPSDHGFTKLGPERSSGAGRS
jgi:hypothetical protein